MLHRRFDTMLLHVGETVSYVKVRPKGRSLEHWRILRSLTCHAERVGPAVYQMVRVTMRFFIGITSFIYLENRGGRNRTYTCLVTPRMDWTSLLPLKVLP